MNFKTWLHGRVGKQEVLAVSRGRSLLCLDRDLSTVNGVWVINLIGTNRLFGGHGPRATVTLRTVRRLGVVTTTGA